MTAVLGGRDGWNSDYFAVCLDTPRLCGSRLRFVREPSTETSVRFSWITARKPKPAVVAIGVVRGVVGRTTALADRFSGDWQEVSVNFVITEFSEVRLPLSCALGSSFAETCISSCSLTT
jgi:hypothetical protein